MKGVSVFFILVALLLGGACYFATDSVLYAALTFFILVIDYFVLLLKKFKHYLSVIERVHTSYHFINSFVITLSVKNSLEDAYQNGIRINNARLNSETNALTEMTVIERVKYLQDYFSLSIYMMFLNVLDLYQDQGGNILSMADNLLRECTRTEKTLTDALSIGNKHLKEFIILWLMSMGILLFMRFSLKDFYGTMLKNNLIGILIFMFFIICIVSINLFVNAFTDLAVKESKKW